ncbi:MAG: hypothetical protein GX451_10475 [Acholeplasmataceae bacterium]|nr:hypothetical protein [Acholeplasmataceae bacterium]
MMIQHYFYNCSQDHINRIDRNLFSDIVNTIQTLEKREKQSEINEDILISLAKQGWSFDTVPSSRSVLKRSNNRRLCLTSFTLEANWHSDFAKVFNQDSNQELVQLEVQFGKVESMFKDFCGFKIAYFERRLALGIELVMNDPNKYFANRKKSVSGMAYFDIAKQTLPAIGLNCPIWLIGIG